MTEHRITVTAGDRVRVELSAYDLTRDQLLASLLGPGVA